VVTVSHLNRRGTVLLRYMTGDISALASEPCSRCGRGGPRFTVTPYRLSGLTKIKGVLVNPAGLHEALAAVRRLDAYQIVVSKERGDPYGLDELIVRVLCDARDVSEVSADIIHRIRTACEVTPRVEPVAAEIGAQWAQGYKHEKFLDTREQPRRS
jgi:phenylacetate-coenzyme A ligase PaaK-like adenylate-forming protein